MSNITLASCSINGEPGVAIVLLDYVGEDKMAVMPLFVAITEGMELRFPEGGESGDHSGAPKNPREEFSANKAALFPAPS